MAIKKRVTLRKKALRKKRANVKIARHRDLCDDLYNRLQQNPSDTGILVDLSAAAGWGAGNPLDYLEHMLGRLTSRVQTWGFHAKHPQYQVTLIWIDYNRRRYGVPHRVERTNTSNDLLQSATLTYISISREIGFFP